MDKWYLVQCKPKQDQRAEENLQRQGYVCYRPMHQVEKLVRGRRTHVSESLFPGYVFVRLGESQSWASLRSTRGVATLVGFGGQPAVVQQALIDCLRERERAAQEAGEEVSLFSAGERLRITEGPFAELQAIYVGMAGEQRAVVLLNILQREQRLRIPLRSLASAR